MIDKSFPFYVSSWPAAAAAVLLFFAALGRWPYDFYTLLRLGICSASFYVVVKAIKAKRPIWAWLMVGIAVLFNPLLPVYVRRGTWRVLDLFAAACFAVSAIMFGTPHRGDQ